MNSVQYANFMSSALKLEKSAASEVSSVTSAEELIVSFESSIHCVKMSTEALCACIDYICLFENRVLIHSLGKASFANISISLRTKSASGFPMQLQLLAQRSTRYC